MRIVYYFLLALLIWSCKTTPEKSVNEVADYVPIKGTIENAANASLFLYLNDYSIQIRTDTEGSFIDTLLLDNPGIYEFEFGNAFHKIYLENGTEIHFKSTRANPVKSLRFLGENAIKNNTLADMNRIWAKEIKDDSLFYSLPKDLFAQRLTRINNRIKSYLNAKTELSATFITDLKEVIKRDVLRKKIEYPQAFANFRGVKSNENFSNELNAVFLSPDSADFYQLPSYKQLTLDYWNNRLSENPMDYTHLQKIKTKSIRDELTELFADLVLQSVPNDSLNKVSKKLQKNANPEAVEMIEERVENIRASAQGKPSPRFKLLNPRGEIVRLADFSGKKVYIDLWATWCKPCIDEIPELKQLEIEFKKEDVAFVSISIDEPEDKDKWITALKKHELKGNQLFRDESFDVFLEHYNVNAIPRFILLDKQGKILHANAPRPGTEEIRGLLKS